MKYSAAAMAPSTLAVFIASGRTGWAIGSGVWLGVVVGAEVADGVRSSGGAALSVQLVRDRASARAVAVVRTRWIVDNRSPLLVCMAVNLPKAGAGWG